VRTWRAERSTLCASLLLISSVLLPAACRTGAATEALRIETCRRPGFERDLRCGTLTVPEDPSAPGGRTIDLTFVVLPAQGRTQYQDAVLYLVGGPGLAATDGLPSFRQALDELQRTRDIVLVDQRGTGASDALHCAMAPAEFLAAFLAGEFETATLEKCLTDLDADPTLYTSAEIVGDFEALRSALGYEQFNLVGISYGTRLALDYVRRYPLSARTVALRGVASPAGNLLSDIGAASEEALARLFARCSADPSCASSYPGLEETLRRLLSRLDREPQQILFPDDDLLPLGLTVSRDLFAGAVRLALYSDSSAREIPALIVEAARGEWSSLEAGLARYAGSGLPSGLSFGSYLSIACSEDLPFFEPKAAVSSTEPFFFTSSVIDNFERACRAWPHRPAPSDFKQPVASDVPALLMSGSEDPATSARATEMIAGHLSDSRHLVTPGLAHFPFWTDCFARNVARLVESGTTSTVDDSCVADYTPAAAPGQ
jgi:pimeloyl-ACP methyl ester carboxylesterase